MKATAQRSLAVIALLCTSACNPVNNDDDDSQAIADSRCLNTQELTEKGIPIRHNVHACVSREGLSIDSMEVLVREGATAQLQFKAMGNNHLHDFVQATENLLKTERQNLQDPTQGINVHYFWQENPQTAGRYTLTQSQSSNPGIRFKSDEVQGVFSFSLRSELLVYRVSSQVIIRKIEGPITPRFSLNMLVEEFHSETSD